MKRNRLKNVLSQRGAYLKASIAGTRGRAKFAGIIYLLATIALAALVAIMPLYDAAKQTLAPIGVMTFWQQFMPANFANLTTVDAIVKFVNAALYGLMLIGVVINVLRALGRLNWLFKRKASKTYGFNRNVYAMEDLGNIFSGSFAVILSTYFLIALVSGQLYPTMWMLVVVGLGAFVHLFAGFIGGKVSYFDIIDGEIEEQKRTVSRFPALFRNVLQLAAVGVILYFFLLVSNVHTVIGPLMEVNGIQNYVMGQPMAYLSIVCQLLTVIFVLPLIKHATATTEYNIDGAYGRGMKTFRVFSFFTLLSAGATAACRYILGEITFTVANGATSFEVVKYLDKASIIIAVVALVMFIIELIMRKAPGHKEEKLEKKAKKEKKVNEDDFVADYSAIADKPETTEEPAPELQPVPNPASPYINMPLYINVDTRDQKTTTPPPPVVEDNANEEEEESEEEETEEEVVEETFEVNCPICGKALRIKEGPTHYRCPACGKVFQTRKVMK